MMARSIAAIVLLALAGCAGPGRRPDLPAGAVVEITPSQPAPLAPATDLVLANPLGCLEPLRAASGGGLAGAVFVCVCVPAVAAVDLVALPVLAVVRQREERELATLSAGCPLADPGARAAEVLLDGLVSNHGLARPGAPGSGTSGVPTLRLVVATERFSRSGAVDWRGAVAWRGRASLVDPSGQFVWTDRCEVETAKRDVPAILRGCEAARAEVASLAATCAHRWLDGLARASAPPAPAAPPAAPPD